LVIRKENPPTWASNQQEKKNFLLEFNSSKGAEQYANVIWG
jgi:hypothetical protein